LRGLQGLDLEYARGDILDELSLQTAALDCDAIIHTAAVYRYWAQDPDEIIEPALTGTRNVINAASQASVKRLIFTSTAWAVGLADNPQTLLTANHWNDNAQNPYAVAKTQAEKVAWRLANELHIPMIAICPGGVIGPYDFRLTPSMRTFRDLVNGTQFTVNAGFTLADVRDVAAIHAMAIAGGQPGKRYLVSGPNLTFPELGQLIGSLTGHRPPHLPVGRSLATIYGALREIIAKITGGDPPLTRATARESIGRYMFTDCRATWQTFQYQPRSAEIMAGDAIRWLLFRGELKANRAKILAEKFPPDPAWRRHRQI
jgi:dihydroflavonol-4-reductase